MEAVRTIQKSFYISVEANRTCLFHDDSRKAEGAKYAISSTGKCLPRCDWNLGMDFLTAERRAEPQRRDHENVMGRHNLMGGVRTWKRMVLNHQRDFVPRRTIMRVSFPECPPGAKVLQDPDSKLIALVPEALPPHLGELTARSPSVWTSSSGTESKLTRRS